jgi:ribosome-binding protein aMBF1 (putative translation factor)
VLVPAVPLNISGFGIRVKSRYISGMSKRNSLTDQSGLQALLRAVRTEAGLRQADLAARLHQPQSFVSKYESGERRLDILELREVCQAIGIQFQEFVARLEDLLN